LLLKIVSDFLIIARDKNIVNIVRQKIVSSKREEIRAEIIE